MFLRSFLGLPAGAIIHVNPQFELRRYLGVDEIQLKPVIRELLKPGFNSFDVGGSTGYYAVSFAQMTGGKVVTFEPDKTCIEAIRETVARNHLDICLVDRRVSARTSSDSITLDAAASKYFHPDFIKMDIEGDEAAALAGATEILIRRQACWIIETHSKRADDSCLSFLNAAGYTVKAIDPSPQERKVRSASLNRNRWLVATPTQ